MNPTIKNHREKIIGYKAFKKDDKGIYTDGNGNCEKIYFKLNKIYTNKGQPELCKNGFHFFRHYCFAIDYLEKDNVIYKVESLGEIQEDTEKCVTNKIKILELIYEDVDENNNSGNRNSGNWNSGDGNSGNGNSGYWNSGDGYRNYFCTQTKYFLFDKEISEIPQKLFEINFSWFELKKEENFNYKKAWSRCPKEVLDIYKSIPEFQTKEAKNKFFEITGLKI